MVYADGPEDRNRGEEGSRLSRRWVIAGPVFFIILWRPGG
jgi:hypothetical protein